MMIPMMTFTGNALREGMAVEAMARFMKDMAKANPAATVEDLGPNVFVAWPFNLGPGSATIQRPGQPDETIPAHPTRTRPAILSLPCGAVIRLAPDDAQHQGVRFITSANAEIIEQIPGDQGPPPSLPSMANASALDQAYASWLANGDVGSSSKALSQALCRSIDPSSLGAAQEASIDHPHDWSDFGRCIKMLDAIPRLRENLDQMASISPAWRLIHSGFDRLEATWRARNQDTAPFSQAVLEDIPPAPERLQMIGSRAAELAVAREELANHGAALDGIDYPGKPDPQTIQQSMDDLLALHLGAAHFEPYNRSPRKVPSR